MEIVDGSLRRSFEGPAFVETLGGEEQGDSDQQDANGNGGTERPVVGGAEKTLHDVGDHGGGRADDERGEEIAEREDEGEGGSGDQAGNGKRKNYAEERGATVCAEILRGFEERTGDVLEGGVNGKENKGRVDVREHEDDGKGAVEKEADGFVRDVEILEKTVQHA